MTDLSSIFPALRDIDADETFGSALAEQILTKLRQQFPDLVGDPATHATLLGISICKLINTFFVEYEKGGPSARKLATENFIYTVVQHFQPLPPHTL